MLLVLDMTLKSNIIYDIVIKHDTINTEAKLHNMEHRAEYFT